MALYKEKLPNWGLKWRANVGIIVPGLTDEREKWAEKIRGESLGEPKRPRPDFREREKGIVMAEEAEGA